MVPTVDPQPTTVLQRRIVFYGCNGVPQRFWRSMGRVRCQPVEHPEPDAKNEDQDNGGEDLPEVLKHDRHHHHIAGCLPACDSSGAFRIRGFRVPVLAQAPSLTSAFEVFYRPYVPGACGARQNLASADRRCRSPI